MATTTGFVRRRFQRNPRSGPRHGSRRRLTRLSCELLESRCLLSAASLTTFGSAEELKQYLVDRAVTQYQSMFGHHYDWGSPEYLYCFDGKLTPLELSTATGATADASQTNTQVAGVDEGDLIETDGNYLYLISENTLTIVDARLTAPAVASRSELTGRATAEYLLGDRLMVLSDSTEAVGDGKCHVTATLLDISDRQSPHVVQTTTMDGWLQDSRAIGSHVELVLQNGFGLPAPNFIPDGDSSEPSSSQGDEAIGLAKCAFWGWHPRSGRYETQEEYLTRVEAQVLDLALPQFTTTGSDGQLAASGLLSQSTDIFRPASDNDYMLTSIVALDMASDAPGPVASIGIPTTGWGTIYASTENLYFLSGHWNDGGATTAITAIHLDPASGRPELSARGEVPGTVLNQFSVDEYQGCLRVATSRTLSNEGWRQQTDLYVLRQDGENLAIVGQLTDLAPNEQIYSARFLGDRAFLVTFHRTDSLFDVDLSDPESPRVTGQLVLPGFSNYLQMADDGHLIGIGRDVDPVTNRQGGPQVSLFDVTDTNGPQLQDRYTIDVGTWNSIPGVYDHHAISYFPEHAVLAMPVSSWGAIPDDTAWGGVRYVEQAPLWIFQLDTGAGGADASDAKIHLLAKVTHADAILRSVRIGDFLYAISAGSITVHDLGNQAEQVGELVLTTGGPAVTPPSLGIVLPSVDPCVGVQNLASSSPKLPALNTTDSLTAANDLVASLGAVVDRAILEMGQEDRSGDLWDTVSGVTPAASQSLAGEGQIDASVDTPLAGEVVMPAGNIFGELLRTLHNTESSDSNPFDLGVGDGEISSLAGPHNPTLPGGLSAGMLSSR